MIALLALALNAWAAEPAEVHGSFLGILVLLPDAVELPIAVGRLDWGYLHIEPRYGYEGVRVGSLFVGANFSVGNEVVFSATPMVGGVFGETWGVAPGWELDLFWKFIDLYAEGEVLIDVVDPSNSYVYVWNELNFFPTDFLRLGLALQRTRTYNADLFLQPGVFIGFSDSVFGISLYTFNLGIRPPTWTLSVMLAL